MKNQYAKPNENGLPIIDIGEDGIEAFYYDDDSGEITLFDRGNYFFHREDATLKYHIEYLKKFIKNSKNSNVHISIAKKAIEKLKLAQRKYKL